MISLSHLYAALNSIMPYGIVINIRGQGSQDSMYNYFGVIGISGQ